MIGALSRIQAAIGIGLVVALAIALGWGVRVDHLRGIYLAQLGRISVAIETVTGARVLAAGAPIAIEAVGIVRDRYRQQRDDARGTVERQSASIRTLEAATARQAAIGARNRQLAEATARERDVWIARAAAAETRTARLSAEAEVAECDAVLDALYADGF